MQIPDHLIIRFLSNEATPEEQIELFSWVSASEKNKSVFEEYCEIWRVQLESPKFDDIKALEKLQFAINSRKQERPRTQTWVVAASITFFLLVVASGSLWWLSRPEEVIAMEKRIVPAGQKLRIVLPDGSTVILNSASQLSWPKAFNDTLREVTLQGEAFFDVKRKESQPFLIHTGEVNTRVLGTSFNINAGESRTEVSVRRGRVRVSHHNQQKILAPMDKVIVDFKTDRLLTVAAEEDVDFGWLQGILVFDNHTLPDAFTILEKWYNVKIRFDESKLRNCRITGKYKKEKLVTVLEAISEATGIKYSITKREVTITGDGCH